MSCKYYCDGCEEETSPYDMSEVAHVTEGKSRGIHLATLNGSKPLKIYSLCDICFTKITGELKNLRNNGAPKEDV